MKKQIITSMLICMFLIELTSASLTATITTPQVTFNNLTGQQVGYYIGVRNDNVFVVNISITKPEGLDITFDALDFSLNPNELRKVNYTINLNKNGTFKESVPVVFYTNESSFGLSAKIILIVHESNTTNTVPQETIPQENVPISSGGGSSSNFVVKNSTKNESKNVTVASTETLNSTVVENETVSNDVTTAQDVITSNSVMDLINKYRVLIISIVVIAIVAIYFYISKQIKKARLKKEVEETEEAKTEK